MNANSKGGSACSLVTVSEHVFLFPFFRFVGDRQASESKGGVPFAAQEARGTEGAYDNAKNEWPYDVGELVLHEVDHSDEADKNGEEQDARNGN